jgi:hypothetical protein
MPYSNISAEITPAQYDLIVAKFNELKALFTFLINLTPEERQALPKMGNDKQPFVTKAFQYAQSFPLIAPPFINLGELGKDRGLALILIQVLQLARPFVESIDDTQLAAGSEAYVASLSIYNSAAQAAKANVPGASAIYEDLKTHFEQTGGGTPTPPPPTP